MWPSFATTPQRCCISARRGHQVAVPQLPGSGDSPLAGVPLHLTVTPVHSGVPEHSGGLSLSPSPAPSYRVVSSPGGFSVYQSHVAGPIRLICNIRMFFSEHCIFLTLSCNSWGLWNLKCRCAWWWRQRHMRCEVPVLQCSSERIFQFNRFWEHVEITVYIYLFLLKECHLQSMDTFSIGSA